MKKLLKNILVSPAYLVGFIRGLFTEAYWHGDHKARTLISKVDSGEL